MIKLYNVPGATHINLYEVFREDIAKDNGEADRIALFFASPWSLSVQRFAEMLGFLKKELNSLEKRDFLQVFVVPAEVNENDNEGLRELARLANGYSIVPVDSEKDQDFKVLID